LLRLSLTLAALFALGCDAEVVDEMDMAAPRVACADMECSSEELCVSAPGEGTDAGATASIRCLPRLVTCGSDVRCQCTHHCGPYLMCTPTTILGGPLTLEDQHATALACTRGLPRIGCSDFRYCFVGCFADIPGATTTECITLCAKGARMGAAQKFSDALTCGMEHCLGSGEGMIGKCERDGEAFVNEDGSAIQSTDPGTGSKRCGACLNEALAALYSGACADIGSPDCNPSQCAALTSACLDDR